MRRTTALLAVFICSACMWGTPVGKFAPANSPLGATITYAIDGHRNTYRAELFAADDTHIYVYNETLRRVRWDRLTRIGMQGTSLFRPATRPSAERAKFALVSRFPQGLSDPLLEEVLQRLGQATVEEIP